MKTLKDRLWAVYSSYYLCFNKALYETRNGKRTLQLDRKRLLPDKCACSYLIRMLFRLFTCCICDNSKGDNRKYKHVLQQTFSYSKSSIQTPEKGVNLWCEYQKDTQ